MKITTIGLDLAKSVFAVHGIDVEGKVGQKRDLRRHQVLKHFAKLEPCVVGMEASSGAHFWARELAKLGHTPKLMPASYVKAYVKRGKTDAADAEAICEAVTRPTMRFVPVKSVEQQSKLALHQVRDLLMRQRTQTTNTVRGLCAEFGITAAKGKTPLVELFDLIADEEEVSLPSEARLALTALVGQYEQLSKSIAQLDGQIWQMERKNEDCRRVMTIPGYGPLSSSALVLKVGDISRFRSGRDLAAWIGLTPKANSSGGKHKLGRISKQGDRYLRKLLVLGATSLVKVAQTSKTPIAAYIRKLLERRPRKVVILAVANKLARIAWAVLAKGGEYRSAMEIAPTA